MHASTFLAMSLVTGLANAQLQVTEIIDSAGDGGGNELLSASQLVVDSLGDVFVVGQDSSNLFRIADPCGDPVVTELIDETGDGVNPLTFARDVVVDASGNAYVIGYQSNNVFQIDPNGVIQQVLDASGDGQGNLVSLAQSLAVDSAGNLYVASWDTDTVFRIVDPGGTNDVSVVLDSAGDGVNSASGPIGLAFDGSGNLYVSCQFTDNVFRIDPQGAISLVLDSSGDGAGNTLDLPFRLAVDGNDAVYVSCFTSDNVFRIDPGGAVTEVLNASGDGQGNLLEGPRDIDVDSAGNLYVTSSVTNTVLRVEDPSGAGVVTVILDASGDGQGNVMDAPLGIAVDASSNVFVSGQLSSNVFKISPLLASSCTGDGGDQMGCSDCPCGNEAPPGTVGGCINSAGTAATLIASGNPSIGVPDLSFHAEGMPVSTAGVLVSGLGIAPVNPVNPCFGTASGVMSSLLDGLRCAVSETQRHGVRASDANGAIRTTTNGWNAPNFPGFAAFAAGTTRHFQLFYRDDVAAVCGTGQNTTQAISATFVP